MLIIMSFSPLHKFDIPAHEFFSRAADVCFFVKKFDDMVALHII